MFVSANYEATYRAVYMPRKAEQDEFARLLGDTEEAGRL